MRQKSALILSHCDPFLNLHAVCFLARRRDTERNFASYIIDHIRVGVSACAEQSFRGALFLIPSLPAISYGEQGAFSTGSLFSTTADSSTVNDVVGRSMGGVLDCCQIALRRPQAIPPHPTHGLFFFLNIYSDKRRNFVLLLVRRAAPTFLWRRVFSVMFKAYFV